MRRSHSTPPARIRGFYTRYIKKVLRGDFVEMVLSCYRRSDKRGGGTYTLKKRPSSFFLTSFPGFFFSVRGQDLDAFGVEVERFPPGKELRHGQVFGVALVWVNGDGAAQAVLGVLQISCLGA